MSKRPANSGSFAKGNAAGKHGNKPGRPPDEATQAIRDLLSIKKLPGRKLTMRNRAIKTLDSALGNVDSLGNVTVAAIRAAELILAYTDGEPKQVHEHKHKHEGGIDLNTMIDGAVLARINRAAREAG